jgi:DNA-binding response OmpR family regulator
MTGQQALDQTALRDPAAVILDLGLPDLDGQQHLPRAAKGGCSLTAISSRSVLVASSPTLRPEP